MSRLDHITLHLKLVHPILLLIQRNLTFPRQLPSLSDRDESRTESEGNNRTKEEASGVKTYNNVGRGSGVFGVDVMNEVGDEFLKGLGISEEGEDVEEGDSLTVSAMVQSMVWLWCTCFGQSGCTPSRDLR